MLKVFCALLVLSWLMATNDKTSLAFAIIYAATAAAIVALKVIA